MKKKTYISLLICICLSVSVFSQTITETIRQLPSTKVHVTSDFEKENYVERTIASGVKTYSPKQDFDFKSITDETVTLTIEFDYDRDLYYPDQMIIIDGKNYNNSQYKGGEDIMYMYVPQGTYDMVCVCWDMPNFNSRSYIVLEQVEVTGDMSVSIRPAEAVNLIKGEVYNLAGEELRPGVISEDWSTIIGGNIDVMIASYSLIHTESGFAVSTNSLITDYVRQEDDLILPLRINDVSDRFTIAQSRICVDNEGEFYFNKFVCSDVNTSQILKNNPEDYVIHTEDFQISPKGKEMEKHYAAFHTKTAWSGLNFGVSWSAYSAIKEHNEGEGIKLHLNNRISDKFNPSGFDFLVSSAFADYLYAADNCRYTRSAPLAIGPDNEVIYGNFGSDSFNFMYLITNKGDIRYMPFHERFTFDSKQNGDIVLGASAPIASVMATNYYVDYLGRKISSVTYNYLGRYGDYKLSDYDPTLMTIKHEGEELFSGSIYELDMWTLTSGISDMAVFEITLDNQNVEVDGLPGKNYTQMTYDARKEDWTPPTVQMLQFRNNDGRVTDRFTSPADGTVRLAAGDFEYINIDNNNYTYYFNYHSGNSVNFYYAPYDTEDWEEIALTEYPEYLQPVAFGDYYEASLADVNHTEGTTAWYDVRIVCTDAAGNSQTQVLSPAFKIDDSVGIKEIEDRNALAKAFPNPFTDKVTITFNAPITGKAQFEIYDLLGRVVYQEKVECGNTSSFKWNGSSAKEGVYIYKIQHNSNSFTGKIVKK